MEEREGGGGTPRTTGRFGEFWLCDSDYSFLISTGMCFRRPALLFSTFSPHFSPSLLAIALTVTPTVPGYDWDKKGGFFDETAENMENDFMDTYGDWRPQTEDD